jgi:hypothetical protein
MFDDPLHQGLLFGLFAALGIGIEHMRIRWSQKRKQKLRRQSLGMNTRRETEPYWSRAEHVAGLRK